MSLDRQFARIAGVTDAKDQIAAFVTLIDEIMASGSEANLQILLSRLLANDFSQQVIVMPLKIIYCLQSLTIGIVCQQGHQKFYSAFSKIH